MNQVNYCLIIKFNNQLIRKLFYKFKKGSKVTYSEVPVEADGIPPWGRCFKRKGNQVIFKDTNGAQNCIRCFHLTLKSPNVIQILTEGKF